MAFAPAELKDDDLLYSFLDEYLDGELPAEVQRRLTPLLQKVELADIPERYQVLRGKLQLALQSFYLKEAEHHELKSYVQDQSAQDKEEASKIEELGHDLVVTSVYRKVALGALVLAAAGGTFWKLSYHKERKFKPLEYLGYEALALEEDAQERLNLPSHDAKEVRQYLNTYPGLDFKPRMLRNMPGTWQLDGATVIDYEIAKVVAVMYESGSAKNKEKVFHFTFAGELSDLPTAEPGNMRGLIFQTYASDALNLVAWQSAPGVVSILVGRRSAPELAEMAVGSTSGAGSGASDE